jgi:Cdc6-like AAA superfamily ATPase
MDRNEALRVIYAFRNGIPPENHVSSFTVGRQSEMEELTKLIQGKGDSRGLLLQANSGSGKTHLLRFVRDTALEEGIAVGSVTLDSSAEVKLNRMDQILAAIFRDIQLPGLEERGIRPFFDTLAEQISDARYTRDPENFWTRLTNDWTWDASDLLQSPALYIALRAWSCGGDEEKDLIEDWLSYPWNYYKNRTYLVRSLIEDLKAHFKDPRPRSILLNKKTEIFRFDLGKYLQCWDALHDLQTLSRAAGHKDFILLMDEVEDVIYNLNHLKWQQIAFRNLIRLFSADAPVMSFFAVTPDFEEKCRELLIKRKKWSEEFAPLETLSRFRVSALHADALKELAMSIAETHGMAYEWEDKVKDTIPEIESIVERLALSPVADRTRQTVKAIVEHLDQANEDME